MNIMSVEKFCSIRLYESDFVRSCNGLGAMVVVVTIWHTQSPLYHSSVRVRVRVSVKVRIP